MFRGIPVSGDDRECVRRGAQLVFHSQNNTARLNDWKIPVHHAVIVARAAENTIWFASCNACLLPHQNCRSMVVASDGQTHAQTELKQEVLLTAEFDIDRATRAMFNYDRDGCAPLLFGDTVRPEKYQLLPTKR